MAEELQRTLDFMLGTLELTAEEVRQINEGFVVRSPSLPEVWALNHVRLTQPVSYEKAVALADRHLAELSYRQIQIVDEPTGRGLEDTFRAEGWKFERQVVMSLARNADRDINTGIVIEAGEEETLLVMRRWYGEDPATTADGLRQLLEYVRQEARARRDRSFAVPGSSDGLLAIAKLRCAGRVAQVEDVYTAPEARGRGYGRALVTHAAAEARRTGNELVFIVADDGDWPKHLYWQIGFDPIGFTWSFHRDAARGR